MLFQLVQIHPSTARRSFRSAVAPSAEGWNARNDDPAIGASTVLAILGLGTPASASSCLRAADSTRGVPSRRTAKHQPQLRLHRPGNRHHPRNLPGLLGGRRIRLVKLASNGHVSRFNLPQNYSLRRPFRKPAAAGVESLPAPPSPFPTPDAPDPPDRRLFPPLPFHEGRMTIRETSNPSPAIRVLVDRRKRPGLRKHLLRGGR